MRGNVFLLFCNQRGGVLFKYSIYKPYLKNESCDKAHPKFNITEDGPKTWKNVKIFSAWMCQTVNILRS